MGISSSKSKQTNDPWKPAQPFILQGLENSGRVFDQTQPQLEQYAGTMRDTYGRVAPGAETGLLSTQALTNDTIAGKYLDRGNPYAERMIGATLNDVEDRVNRNFVGSWGGAYHAKALADSLGDTEARMRGGIYDAERSRQIQATGTAQDLMRGSQGLLSEAANLPWLGVGALNGNVRQASQGYGTTTTKSTPGLYDWMSMFSQNAARAAQGGA